MFNNQSNDILITPLLYICMCGQSVQTKHGSLAAEDGPGLDWEGGELKRNSRKTEGHEAYVLPWRHPSKKTCGIGSISFFLNRQKCYVSFYSAARTNHNPHPLFGLIFYLFPFSSCPCFCPNINFKFNTLDARQIKDVNGNTVCKDLHPEPV